MLRDCQLDHEIQETREAERYKFGDGGTSLSAVRATAFILSASKTGKVVFGMVTSKCLPLLIGREFLTPRYSCRGHGTEDI